MTLESIAQLFYLPWIFWGVPFLFAAAIEIYSRLRRGRTRRARRTR